jgi:glycine betaine/proline transport system ATP-binding protein
VLRDGEVVQQGSGQQIVLKPADDYVARFVRDVNRGRIVRVETIMEAGADPGDDALTIPEGTVLEEAMLMLGQSAKRTARIVDADQRLLGTVKLADLIGAAVVPAQVERGNLPPES